MDPSANTRFNTPAGTPARHASSHRARAHAAAYSAGFHTTAFPHSNAGARYHDGTATGKFPAVTTTATPTGTRYVNSCLSGISDGTVCPYSRRPSPRKNSQVSMISCTSPSASARGLPTSRVTSRASAALFAATSRPNAPTTWPRTGAGTCAHSRCACRAAAHADRNVTVSASATRATTSSSRAGLLDTYSVPPPTSAPSIIDLSMGPD